MTDVAPLRLACPACLGVALEKASAGQGVEIDHCRRCGGTWILRDQASRLRAVPAAALRATLTRAGDAAFACHACHAPMDRGAASCLSCGWRNSLECPECGRAMRRQTERAVTVDVCRGCRGVWLDHDELASLWAAAAAGAVAHSRFAGDFGAMDVDAGSFLLDALWFAPELTIRAGGAAVEAAAQVPGLLASTPEVVAGAAEAAGEAAGSVFGFILEIIGGIFEGL